MSSQKVITITSLIEKVGRRLHMATLAKWTAYRIQQLLMPPRKWAIDIEKAEEILNKLHKDLHNSAVWELPRPQQYKWDLEVIIPVYNAEDYIQKCIDSVLNQETQYSFHIILVNDSSTDRSAEIIQTYKDNAKITILHQKNSGVSVARNNGLRHTEAKYVTFIDSDDMMAPGAIEAYMKEAYANDADIVEGSYRRISPEGKFFAGEKRVYNNDAQRKDMAGFVCMKAIRTSLFEHICFPASYWHQDTITAMLLVPASEKRILISNDVYYYTYNTNSMSFSPKAKPKRLETLYVTRAILEGAKKLGLISKDPQYAYHNYLKQVRMNRFRTESLGLDVEWAVFCIHCDLLKKYFENITCTEPNLKDIEIALKTTNISLYRRACLMY